ncbi:MAG: hypothetical protein KF729_09875 [Sandaracinaceae bacterium]|nr:hypothetical protein [Sandaracinaceae bacterium]
MDLVGAHVELRRAAIARHGFFEGPRAPAEEKLGDYLAPIHAEGEVRALQRGGAIDAIVAWRFDEASWFGTPVWTIAIDRREGADVARWLDATLAAVIPALEGELDLSVDAGCPEAYRALRRLGLGVDSVQLVGDVEAARARLGGGALPDGVTLAPMEEADVEPVLALYEETFRAAPEHCWFGAYPGYLEKQRAQLVAGLGDGTRTQTTLRTDRGVRGHASATVALDNPLWGPIAGMSLCFAPELRGRGVLRPVYRHLLDAMHAAGARTFKGGTSQPPVLRLASEMGRELTAVNLRRDTPFGEAHFAPYLPL